MTFLILSYGRSTKSELPSGQVHSGTGRPHRSRRKSGTALDVAPTHPSRASLAPRPDVLLNFQAFPFGSPDNGFITGVMINWSVSSGSAGTDGVHRWTDAGYMAEIAGGLPPIARRPIESQPPALIRAFF